MIPVTFIHTVGDRWIEVPGHPHEEPSISISWSEVERLLRKDCIISSAQTIQSVRVTEQGLSVRWVRKAD